MFAHTHTWTKGYFHSTRASAAMRIGLLRVRQHRALGARRADLLACVCFLAPPAFLCPAEPVELSVSVLLGSAKLTPSEIKGFLIKTMLPTNDLHLNQILKDKFTQKRKSLQTFFFFCRTKKKKNES